MKLIDVLNKIANNEEIPVFRLKDHRYKYFMKKGFLYQQKFDYDPKPVEWQIYYEWLNKEIQIIGGKDE